MAAVVSCVGSINVDATFRLDRLPERHEKLAAYEARLSGGGSAANTAVWLARQGLRVLMHGWVGEDFPGAFALQDLRANGVDTAGVNVLPAATPVAACFALPDDKRIVTSPKLDAPWAPDAAAARAGAAAWLHTTVCDRGFLTRARGGPPVSVELNGKYDAAFATLADFLFTNRDELERAAGAADPIGFIVERHAADPAVWFVTQGEAGAAVIRGGKVACVSAAPVAVVDRTGGGDAFDAGVIAALLAGEDLRDAAAAGLALAAQALGRLGAR
ncbi:MAG TPA: PfkB family carbohydrate kinase [Methylocystis sp.]|nr:PfkB family carbohydrate kinase [Methylocystis sp.]